MTPLLSRAGRLILLAAGVAALAVGCGVLTSSEPIAIKVLFRGYAPTASSTMAVLTTSDGRRAAQWLGDHARTEDLLGDFPVPPGDSLYATAAVRDQNGALLAEARVAWLVQADYDYAVLFQVGGVNPDLQGFCHHSPARVPLAGSSTDTLFLWSAGLPRGAVC